MYISQPEVAASKAVGQSFMVQPKEMQHRGVQIMDMHPILNCIPSEFVCGSKGHAAANSTASHPHRKSKRMMIPAVFSLGCRSPSKFSAPDHKRVLQKAASFQIGQQPGNWSIRRQSIFLVSCLES